MAKDKAERVRLAFAEAAEVEKYAKEKPARAPREGVTKETWENKISEARAFMDAVEKNAVKTPVGRIACLSVDNVRGFLGLKKGTPTAAQQAVKRQFALAGMVGERAVRTDKEAKRICIFPDKIEKAPGSNIAEQIIYAKAATQGTGKYGSLIKSLGRFYTVKVSETDVERWLSGRRGAKKPKAKKAE